MNSFDILVVYALNGGVAVERYLEGYDGVDVDGRANEWRQVLCKDRQSCGQVANLLIKNSIQIYLHRSTPKSISETCHTIPN